MRFKVVSEHADITPSLLAVAEQVAGLEVEVRHNIRINDALFAQEAKEMMLEVKSTLFERKKKRVHAAAGEAITALEKRCWPKRPARPARQ